MGRRIDEQTGLVRESQRPLAMDSARRDASFEIFRSGRTSSADKCSLCSRETSASSEFFWFYIQVITNESEAGDRLRQSIRQKPAGDTMLGAEASLLEKFKCATDAALLRFLSDAKDRKPN